MGQYAKRAYETYANSAFRFYARNESGYGLMPLAMNAGDGSSVITMYDWHICQSIIEECSPFRRALILDVYRRNGPFSDIVAHVAAERNVSVFWLWRIISETSRQFARKKGLI